MKEPTSSELREAASAIDTLLAVRRYVEGLKQVHTDFGVRVDWSWGASVNGHNEMAAEVTRIVETQMWVLFGQALENLRIKSEAAMQKVTGQQE